MFSWTISESVKTKASKKQIWERWKDVQGWSEWDEDLEWAKINGPFAAGTKGELKPKGWFVTPFVITSTIHENSFENETSMPLTKVTFLHEIKNNQEQMTISHTVTANGLLAPLLKFTMGRQLKKEIKSTLQRLAILAENKNG